MGMFDQLYYKGVEYQTKDTPNQLLTNYKIEADQDSGHEYLWEQKCAHQFTFPDVKTAKQAK
jgi:hypothetical protein